MFKKLLSALVVLVITATSSAQAPEAINYQAVVRDNSGIIVANQLTGFRVSILQNSPTGAIVYMETHTPTTNELGLVNFQIGQGTLLSGDFPLIDWGNGIYYAQLEIDPAGGTNYQIVTTSQLVSVPYALHAKSADNVFSGDYNDLLNKPVVISTFTNDVGYVTSEVDGDPANELQTLSIANDTIYLTNGGQIPMSDNDDQNEIQTISFSADTLYLSNGGQVYLGDYTIDLINDADADPSNEIQSLSISNDTLYLENGGSVYLGEYARDFVNDADADPSNEIQTISLSNDTLYLSNGGQLYLGDYANDLVDDADADPSNEIQTISRTGTTVTLSNGGGTYTDSVNTYTAGADIDITNNVISLAVATPSSRYYVGQLIEGGVVIFVDASGIHGLVADLNDAGAPMAWGDGTFTSVSGAQDAYDGQANTVAIIAALTSSAAATCDALTSGGKFDWYLPSAFELQLMYQAAYVVPGLDLEAIYWSSTENSGSFGVQAYEQTMFGNKSSQAKNITRNVRAVRKF